VSPTDDAARCSIVATRFADIDVRELAKRLNEAGIVVSARRGVLRFSPHLYNDAEPNAKSKAGFRSDAST
jgi:selenocysteine lyase/cysteine desulfurase